MKDTKRSSQMFGAPPAPSNEGKKLFLMTIALLVLVGLFVFNINKAGSNAGDDDNLPARDTDVEIAVRLPELRAAELDALVQDQTPESQALAQPEVMQLALDDANKLVASHYRVLEPAVLDVELSQAVISDPGAHRMEALRLRGELITLRQRELSSGQEYVAGSMRLDDGTVAHYAATKNDDDLAPGDWARLDGLFVMVRRDSVEGEWQPGALVAGRNLVPSVAPRFTLDQPLELAADGVGTFTPAELPNVINDRVRDGLGYLPVLEKWKLLSRAARAEDQVDWASAPVLDGDLMAKIMAEPANWRGMPVVLPAGGAALLHSDSSPAEENPARIETVADGYLFEFEWKESAEVVYFLHPDRLEIQGDDHQGDPAVRGRGFFFKRLSYEDRTGRLNETPVFVLSVIEALPPVDTSGYESLMYVVFVLTVFLIAGIFLLLRREKKRSEEFQQQRIERLRKKREAARAT